MNLLDEILAKISLIEPFSPFFELEINDQEMYQNCKVVHSKTVIATLSEEALFRAFTDISYFEGCSIMHKVLPRGNQTDPLGLCIDNSWLFSENVSLSYACFSKALQSSCVFIRGAYFLNDRPDERSEVAVNSFANNRWVWKRFGRFFIAECCS